MYISFITVYKDMILICTDSFCNEKVLHGSSETTSSPFNEI